MFMWKSCISFATDEKASTKKVSRYKVRRLGFSGIWELRNRSPVPRRKPRAWSWYEWHPERARASNVANQHEKYVRLATFFLILAAEQHIRSTGIGGYGNGGRES